MKKKDIVKSHEEFNTLIKKGKQIHSKCFAIYYNKNQINHSRYGISVGTKLGNAVFRNKYKRKIRMLINENNTLYNKNCDYIIILRKNAIDLTYNDLKSDFDNLIIKLKEI